MKATLMRLLFGPDWRMVRRKRDGALEVIKNRSAR